MGLCWYRCFALVVAICAGAWTGVNLRAQEHLSPITPRTLDRLHSPLLRQDLQISGAQSCATSNCHAGPRPGVLDASVRRGMEYQVWVERDPHAQSWRTMCSEESVAMMRRLNIMRGDQIVDRAGFDNCLGCHNTTRRFDEPRQWHATASLTPDNGNTGEFRREGVGCAACHGPSQHWIGTHFQRDWSAQAASAHGFVEARDLYVRARMCASCHVGDKDRDMNHDIIAAGHPTLRYELATFHAWQPKHWRDTEAKDKTFYEAQLWLAGQVAATDASLSLLQSRASESRAVSTWPEFAAYDCASCHHSLTMDNDRVSLANGRKATATYSQWNDAGLRWLIDYRLETSAATQDDYELLGALDTVRERMEARPRPDAGAVATAAAHARTVLAEWFDSGAGQRERRGFRSDRLGRVVASAAGKPETFRTWESATQFYLAAVAARESWPGGWNGPIRETADKLQRGLRYPQMIDISRYAKRAGSGPTLTRTEAWALGIELAGWLGPVSPEKMKVDDRETTERMRRELDETLRRINERLETIRNQQIDEQRQKDRDAEDNEKDAAQDDRPTREELLEQLRNRRDSRSQQKGRDEDEAAE